MYQKGKKLLRATIEWVSRERQVMQQVRIKLDGVEQKYSRASGIENWKKEWYIGTNRWCNILYWRLSQKASTSEEVKVKIKIQNQLMKLKCVYYKQPKCINYLNERIRGAILHRLYNDNVNQLYINQIYTNNCVITILFTRNFTYTIFKDLSRIFYF